MRQPTDRVALSAARRMLDQIVMPDAFVTCGFDEPAHSLQLVVARKDHRFLPHLASVVGPAFLDLQVEKPGQ